MNAALSLERGGAVRRFKPYPAYKDFGVKERLIELLQEKRTALITRTVTKGLDPDVPMKDSGAECTLGRSLPPPESVV